MRKHIPLIVVLFLGAFLRLWQLSGVPNGLTWDEAAIGYNAYSILKTGRDEHGAYLPLIFKSFGDYKPGAYIYLTVPSVAIFGLNEFAVRFPSALFGIIGIYVTYLLTKLITKRHGLGVAAALAVSISPWLVHFSHGAWETNVFATLLLFSIYYFIRFTKKDSSIYPAIVFACLSLLMYQGAKLLVPLVYLLLTVLYWREINWSFLKNIKTLPFVIFGIWIYLGAIYGVAGNRLATLSIFNYKPEIIADTPIFHNQILLTTKLILGRYLWHFSPEVLLYEGPIIGIRGHIPSHGLLNPLEFVLLFFGFVYLAKNLTQRSSKLIISLLLISPIPASLTLAEFSSIRALFMAYPLAIISGLGIYFLYTNLRVIFYLISFAYLVVTVYLFDIYFLHSKDEFSLEFNAFYKPAVQTILDNPGKKVVFTDVYGQPYIYYLFYSKYDPAVYQKKGSFIDGGLDVGKVAKIDQIEFRQFNPSDIKNTPDTVFIGTEGNVDNTVDIAGDNIAYFKQINTSKFKILLRIVVTRP